MIKLYHKNNNIYINTNTIISFVFLEIFLNINLYDDKDMFSIECKNMSTLKKIMLGAKLSKVNSFIIIGEINKVLKDKIEKEIKNNKKVIIVLSENQDKIICINREMLLCYENYENNQDIINNLIKIENILIYKVYDNNIIKINNLIKKGDDNEQKLVLLDYYLKENIFENFINKFKIDNIDNTKEKYDYLNKLIVNEENEENKIILKILKRIKDSNIIDYYELIEKSLEYYLVKKEGDINFIIPVKDRDENFYYIIDNIKKSIKNYNIIFTIFEYGNKYKDICKKKEINYISFNNNLIKVFNKSISVNLVYNLYEKENIKYNSIIFHDVDCIVMDNFIENIYYISNKYDFIQTYGNRYVLMADENLSNKIRNGNININKITEKTEGIVIPNKGSPGGSFYIKKDLFKKVGGLDPEFFTTYSCEDMFFWKKVEALSVIGYCDNPLNTIIHLYHYSPRHNDKDIIKNNIYYKSNLILLRMYNSLKNEKIEFIKHCENKLCNF